MATATGLLAELAGVGSDPAGGYSRLAWERPTLELREWFAAEALRRGLDLREDGNGNQFAWWGDGGGALMVGSHLDSVRGGGAFDGPLGVASAFAAVVALRADGVTPSRPLVVANFTDEEGGRFGMACVGSRLATGAVSRDQALALRDDDGTTLAEAMASAGLDPAAAGVGDWLADVETYVELHVEQGRNLVEQGAAVGVASAIWPHGRYRLDLAGQGNHAGTTAMADRRDPMLTFARAVLIATDAARTAGQRATFGRIHVHPGNTNAIPDAVRAWLDARAETEEGLADLVDRVRQGVGDAAAADGTTADLTAESVTSAVDFDPGLRHRLATLLGAPVLPTGAGHDAGILAAVMPTAMLFVRNPTGISHAPDEQASEEDCEAGVAALVRVIRELT